MLLTASASPAWPPAEERTTAAATAADDAGLTVRKALSFRYVTSLSTPLSDLMSKVVVSKCSRGQSTPGRENNWPKVTQQSEVELGLEQETFGSRPCDH